MSSNSKATLSDIARMTHLSQSAVSLILNGKSGLSFSEETVRRVHDAAVQLNYRKSNQTVMTAKIFDKRAVAIFCPTVSNPYYSGLVQSIEQSARKRKYNTFVFNTYRDPSSEANFLSILQNTDIAGIIFTAIPTVGELVEKINQSIPIVVLGDRNKELDIDTVEIDNYKAGVLVAEHLVSLGHRHIAYISTTLNQDNSARVRRLEGMQDTFRQKSADSSILVKAKTISPLEELNQLSVEHSTGYALTKECLPQKDITAFVAVNDMVAYGVVDALRSGGFQIPQDYSVCGFDNIFPSQFGDFGLTTVEHHIQEKGNNAFEILLNRIKNIVGENTMSNRITRVEYQPRLVVRKTTTSPPHSV